VSVCAGSVCVKILYTNGRKLDETLRATTRQMASKADDEIFDVRLLPEVPPLAPVPPAAPPAPPVGPLTVTRGVVSPLISNSSDPLDSSKINKKYNIRHCLV